MATKTRSAPSRRHHVLLLVLAAFGMRAAPAQCTEAWAAGEVHPGPLVPPQVIASWDPDGPGPATGRIVFGGRRPFAALHTAGLAAFDPATGHWQRFGSGCDGPVSALLALPNGDLVAGGQFTNAGGTTAANIARWDGNAWNPIGSGIPATGYPMVECLARLPNGNLVAGGLFLSANGAPADYLAQWDGSSWTPVGTGVDGTVHGLAVAHNGDLLAIGDFVHAGGSIVNRIARWDGTAWSGIGGGIPGAHLQAWCIAVLPNDDIVAGGWIFVATPTGRADYVARFDGSAWQAMGPGSISTVRYLLPQPNGEVYASGTFRSPISPWAYPVARWNGTDWTPLISADGGYIEAGPPLGQLPDGDIIAGSRLLPGGSVAEVAGIARWDGTTWVSLGAGLNDTVTALAALPDGEIVASGDFTAVESRVLPYLARGDGRHWTDLGGVLITSHAMLVLPGGDLVAAGLATGNGETIARWNGTSWSSIGVVGISPILALLQRDNGQFVCGGGVGYAGTVKAWNGTAWQLVGASSYYQFDQAVRALAEMPNGDLVAAGDFTRFLLQPVNHIAVCNGAGWAPMGSGLDGAVHCLLRLPNGDLVAGGNFATAGSVTVNHIAQWNGSAFVPLGSGMAGGFGPTTVYALAMLPDGDVIAGGDFASAGGVPAPSIARWDGSSWTAVDAGTDGVVYALALSPNGDLLAGGDFTRASNRASAHIARLRPSCPAAATAYGVGCSTSAGPLFLSARSLPWLGSSYRAACAALPANGLALSVLGLGSAYADLWRVYPAGGVGCMLLATRDLVQLMTVSAGAAAVSVPIPRDPALVGLRLYQQAIVAEFDPGLAILRLSSSNGLRLTIGAL